jgi:outer membrane protein OmpA-like peptidoglycan-associated protein
MRRDHRSCMVIARLAVLGIVGALPLVAQDGKLKVNAHPPEAYVFVDGQAMGQAYHKLELGAGNHHIDVVNYGYKPLSQDVSVAEGKTTTIEATLEPVSEPVSGPWGSITIEKAQRDAIFLNGKSAAFFVGHGDEFNHDLGRKQELVVPPGTHQLMVVRQGKEIWSGAVVVPADQRVVVDIPGGVRKTVPWSRGEHLSPSPRFKAGIASATVAVAKPTAQLSSQAPQVNCGDSTQLKWTTTDVGEVAITQVGNVNASGEKTVEPKQATTYELKAVGPGGTATASTTVTVNSAVQAELALSPAEVQYKRVGDKIVAQPSSALNWSASNASAVSIDPFGTVDPSGNKPLQVTPKKTDPGPIDETVTYTLTASNSCGGTETKTATLHITGDIAPPVVIAMRSVYFATDRPGQKNLAAGLVPSQQQTLTKLAADFKAFLDQNPGAQITLTGHADRRGAKSYNQALSQRRADAVKSFLVEQGIAVEKIETRAYGADQNMTPSEVTELMAANPDATEQARKEAMARLTTMVYAQNRRVDMELNTGQQSVRNYPFAVEELSDLVKRGPELKTPEEKTKTGY